MKVITIPAEEQVLNELLKQAQESSVILETADGQRFALIALEHWEGFEVGEGDDFKHEVELTGQNEALLKFLAERRTEGKRISLKEVKEQLDLD